MFFFLFYYREKKRDYSHNLQRESESEPEPQPQAENIKVVANNGVKRRIVLQDDNAEAAGKLLKSDKCKLSSDIAASIRYIRQDMENHKTFNYTCNCKSKIKFA